MSTQLELLKTKNKSNIQIFTENMGILIANNDYNSSFTYSDQAAYRNADETQINVRNGNRTIKTLITEWKESARANIIAGRKPLGREPRTSEYTAARDYSVDHILTNGMPTAPPSATQIAAARDKGYNLGQIGGARNADDVFSSNEIFRQLDSLVRTGSLDLRGSLDALFEVSRAIGRLYQPGINRIPEPFLLRMPLDDLLQQNLILPSSTPGTKTATNVFTNTYLANRARTASQPQGRVAGIPITDIQEPENPRSPPSSRRRPIFTFQNDDAVYLTPAKLDRGFTSNINVTTDTLNEAVVHSDYTQFASMARSVLRDAGANSPTLDQVRLTAESIESYGHAENQYFPFLFETENRQGDNEIKQYCFLQATLASLNESFSPNWEGIHFFGRTEDVKTYLNTGRSLDFSFVVFANSMRELQNVRERVTWLAQQCYPSYDRSAAGNLVRMKSGPLLKITIGDLFTQLPGYITSLTLAWDKGGAGGKWEMTKGLRMPQICEVSVNYQVIHPSNPDRDFDFYYGMQRRMNARTNSNVGNLIPRISTGRYGDSQESYNDHLARVG